MPAPFRTTGIFSTNCMKLLIAPGRMQMLRSVTIDNKLLNYLVDVINQEFQAGKEMTRSKLSNAIWDYEKGAVEQDKEEQE